MEDRLKEIKGMTIPTESSCTETDEMIPEFNKKISNIQNSLNKIRDNNKRVQELKEGHLRATLADQEKAISIDLDRLINENAKLCTSLKQELERLESHVKAAKQAEPKEPETRIKDITFRALKGKFAEVLKESQQAHIDYKTAVKEKLGRQVKIIDPTLTQDQVQEICNDPQGAERLMASKLMGSAHLKLKNAVSDIQDKHKDILKLERSVETIHQLFMDMALLVNAQGEMLDNIELNIKEAEHYMKKANKELKKAKKCHQKSRKLKCCVLITLLIIILIVVLVVVLK